jgi:hypothetical protein
MVRCASFTQYAFCPTARIRLKTNNMFENLQEKSFCMGHLHIQTYAAYSEKVSQVHTHHVGLGSTNNIYLPYQ